MPKLSSSICSLLTDDIVEQLKNYDIETVIDFVTKNPLEISRTGIMLIQNVISTRQILVSSFAAFPITAADRWEELKSNSAFFSTGLPSIDSLLNGGVLTGELMELSGPPSIGKTQLCLSLAVRTIVTTKSTVAYIDTNGSFSASRLNQLLSQEYSEHIVVNRSDILEKLIVFSVGDFFQLLDLIQNIETKMKSNAFYSQLHLLIIDSLDFLISSIIGEHFLPFLMQLVAKIRKLAQDNSIAVLYTTGIFSTQGLKPILVKTWVSVPHTKLVIRSFDGDKRIATVEKSQRIKSGSVITF